MKTLQWMEPKIKDKTLLLRMSIDVHRREKNQVLPLKHGSVVRALHWRFEGWRNLASV